MGERKKQYFEAMEPGDPILFYANGTFFASGRVGTTLRDREFGETIWDSDDSGFIYTVEDYQEHSVSTETVADLLDYGDGWFSRGFMRVSETAINALLTEHNSAPSEHNSVEEAFRRRTMLLRQSRHQTPVSSTTFDRTAVSSRMLAG